ncbi:hypothetical protein KS4_14350 [Poriferisphaera corsica]|uniref:Uncharacterized protein n=1 Tax=Poriferisphaera corsica TaxID=2528020 RepID=A0A517YT28_9BACT|nr:DUF2339 domain-containing protein [Poriferisphaera corsica]QDU33389.1 hypothetical protein KS4_14350 [Poriferisphaera corsica]
MGGLGTIFWLGGMVCALGKKRAMYWSILSGSAMVVVYVLVGIVGHEAIKVDGWVLGAGMSVLSGIGCYLMVRRREVSKRFDVAAGVLASAITAVLVLCVWMDAALPWQAVWCGGIMLGVVVAAEYFGKDVLRWTGIVVNGVVVVGAAFGLLVSNQYLVGGVVAGNALLGFWGGLAVLYGLCAWRYRVRGEGILSQVQQVIGLLMFGLGLMMLVHHGFTGKAWHQIWEAGLIEYGVMSVVLGSAGLLLTVSWQRWLRGYMRLREGGIVYAKISGAIAIAGVYVISNPLLEERGVLGSGDEGMDVWGMGSLMGWIGYVLVCCLPVVLLGVNGVVIRDKALAKIRQIFLGMILLLLGICGVLLVRQGFSDGVMLVDDVRVGLYEFATDAIVFLGLGLVMFVYGDRGVLKLLGMRVGGLVMSVLGVIGWVLYCGVFENPLWCEVMVGDWVVLNWLVYVYVLPLLMVGVLCWCVKRWGHEPMKAAYESLVKVLFVGIGLVLMMFVRQGFAGSDMRLQEHPVGLIEYATDAIVLIGVGGLMVFMRERLGSIKKELSWGGIDLQWSGDGDFGVDVRLERKSAVGAIRGW